MDKDPVGRPVGDACTVNDECQSGRCVAGACDDGSCRNDQDCLRDELCVFGACEPADDFACQPDQAPQLSLTPGLEIDFGQVNVGSRGEQVVTVENTGDCLLTLHGVGLDDAGSPGFSCEPCDPEGFPVRIPPFRSFDVTVVFEPETTGDADSILFLNSDDLTAGPDGLVEIALHADYDGTPALDWSPIEINFGYVPYQQGANVSEVRELRITNRGTGNAALVIERIFVDEGIVFSIPQDIDDISPDAPLLIPPYDPNIAETTVVVPVTFTPDENDAFADRLVIRTADNVIAEVPITADTRGPPQINVSETALVFRCRGAPNDPFCDAPNPYPVGLIAFRQFTVTNSGASPLEVNVIIGGSSATGRDDFAISPSFIPPIPPGGAAPFTVFFNPSEAWNPATAFVNITSNDTDDSDGDLSPDVLKTVSLEGYSVSAQNDQVLKLEMEFQNADNSWAGNDFRDVDLELESPTGFTCTKPDIPFVPDGNGGFIPDPNVANHNDYCDQWNSVFEDACNNGSASCEGQVAWIALGQYEEPERIILYGLGPTASEGETFTARIYYIEDCANIPTGLLADILGIGGSILIGVLGGAIGVPIAVPPDQISDTIANNCFDHDSSLTTLHISLNGEEVAAPQLRLDNKGDVREIAHFQRRQGQFCDPAVGIPCP